MDSKLTLPQQNPPEQKQGRMLIEDEEGNPIWLPEGAEKLDLTEEQLAKRKQQMLSEILSKLGG